MVQDVTKVLNKVTAQDITGVALSSDKFDDREPKTTFHKEPNQVGPYTTSSDGSNIHYWKEPEDDQSPVRRGGHQYISVTSTGTGRQINGDVTGANWDEIFRS